MSTSVSHALRGMQEGLPVLSSKSRMDDFMIWASKPPVEGFMGLDLKTRRGRFGGLGLKIIGGRFDSLGLKTRCGKNNKRSTITYKPSLEIDVQVQFC